jgi:hypothetical protein
VRVADIAAFYPDAKSKGAQFLTGPLDRKAEIRCSLRDPDGYLIEIGQATGMLRGVYAGQHAEDSTKPTGVTPRPDRRFLAESAGFRE